MVELDVQHFALFVHDAFATSTSTKELRESIMLSVTGGTDYKCRGTPMSRSCSTGINAAIKVQLLRFGYCLSHPPSSCCTHL